jgi:conjugal transfer pilus assembly protein TraD
VGLPYIHGVEPREHCLHRPLLNFEGGTIIVGTTQSGKGVTLSVLASQAVYRGDVVIVIDPKNSKRLKGNVLRACQDAGRAEAFVEFHPAFPERGIRFDPMFNWQKPTELASRIQSVMPPDTTGSFSAFGWDAVNVVVQGMVELEDRPNLSKLSQCIEGGIEPVLLRSLQRYFAAAAPPTGGTSQPSRQRAAKARSPSVGYGDRRARGLPFHYGARSRATPHQGDRFAAAREPIRASIRRSRQSSAGLSMLTSGDLGRSLSPDRSIRGQTADHEPGQDRSRSPVLHCAGFAARSAVGSALGAILLADLAALAGIRYNLDASTRASAFMGRDHRRHQPAPHRDPQ